VDLETLEGKELHVWVTYPDRIKRKAKKKQSRKHRPPGKDRSLWAVVIIEALKSIDDFTFEVTLRKVFKREERIITIWVCNDPRDQSDNAPVFGFVSPSCHELSSLEQHLSQIAGMRVYHAIVQTWPDAGAESTSAAVVAR
jgi:hypothetical protein